MVRRPVSSIAVIHHAFTISNVVSSEAALPSKARFYVEPPWERGGTKVYINGLGHMTKMATMPIYGKKI